MRVTDLAKELHVAEEAVLKKLRTLKLKAKGPSQELNAVVVRVLKGELKKRAGTKVKKPAAKKKTAAKKPAKTSKEPAKKTVKTKKTTKKTAPVKEPAKTERKKVTIIDAPFEPVKPLAKKRKKPGHRDTRGSSSAQPRTSASGTATAPENVLPAPATSDKDVSDLRPMELSFPVAVKDLAVRLQQKPSLILKSLMQRKIFATINQGLGEEIVSQIAVEFGFRVIPQKTEEQKIIQSHQEEESDKSLLKPRAPVVTFMGHVDHGKTSLLDCLRKSKLTDQEHGGITQHIGAYSVKLPKGKITFLDTPGHEAFTAMRARGAHITDLVVLVIAADEGCMPQTDEAIDHARAAGVPIIVALNKIDRKNADVDMVKKQLAKRELNPEDWGGKTICVGVSAVTGEGVDNLLEMILLEAELLELKANDTKKASGIIVEGHLSHGKGVVASLIVQNGTLIEGDTIVVGSHFGKIRAMFDDHGHKVKSAGPSMPVEILGLPGVPEAGDLFYVVEDEKKAREISLQRQETLRAEKLRSTQKLTLEDIYSKIQEGSIKDLNIIMKADVQGSLEALRDSLEKIESDQIKLRFIHTGIGDINASDVILAYASSAIVIGFHVGTGPRVKAELEKNPVDIRTYRIIYDAVNEIKQAIEGMLEPIVKKNFLGKLEIREVFKLSKSGIVAGCFVNKGKIHRKAHMDIVRNGDVVYTGHIKSLKRFKDDVRDVAEGFECGVTIEGFTDIQVGDTIEAFELEKIARKL